MYIQNKIYSFLLYTFYSRFIYNKNMNFIYIGFDEEKRKIYLIF